MLVNKLIFIFVLFFSLAAYGVDNRLISVRDQKFYKELEELIAKDEQYIMDHLRTPQFFEQTRLQIRMDVAKTKHILYDNFYGTPSVQHPLVRKKLIEIFSKEIIAERDLLELETLVHKIKG